VPNIPVKNCCGCAACENACSAFAIKMQPDKEGFMYPEINNELCCDCGKCEKACPIITPPKLSTKIEACFVAQNEDQSVLDESTSGGFVDALCKHILEEKHGYVCGVAFDADFMPYHKIVDSYEDAKAFRNSKYAQSNTGTVYKDILALLKCDKNVMFIGTPCQVAGLKSFLKDDYENLITVDLVCRSIPSPKLWREYLDWQQKRYGSNVSKVVCRKKTYGYHSGALELEFQNGKRYAGSNRVDYYMKSFHKDICSRNSCYDCQFKTVNRCSDFTVFDSWRPETATLGACVDNNKGYSSVIVHTGKGKMIISGLKKIVKYAANVDILLSFTGGMAIESINRPIARDEFYLNIDSYGFHKTVKKFSKVSFLDYLIELLKPIKYKIENIKKV
jgi:coenzyme F420-reducing hydrogenase beta subunit